MKAALKDLGLALLDALKGLLGSKKVLLALLTFGATLASKYGLNLDPEQLAMVVGPLWLALFGQAAQDVGKEGARIKAAAHIEAAKSLGPPQNPPSA
jgi:hypothetical protein